MSLLTLCMGPAPTFVIEKFNEFKSIYSSITAAICALLEKDHLLKAKYRFYQSDVKIEVWEVEGTPADTEVALQEIGTRLDSYVRYSRLDSRAAAIEELLLSPDTQEDQVSDGETSVEETEPERMEQTENGPEICETTEIDTGVGEEFEEDKTDEIEHKKSDHEKKKKRKNRKPKKHKKKHHEDDDGTEEETGGRRRAHSRDVWRRVGSKFIGWYHCILCDKKQDSEADYMEHLKWHGNTHSPACMDCGNYFESMIDYENHIGNLTKEFIYKCDEAACGKAYQFKCRLECHKRTHTGELMYQCNDCGHKLSSIRSIIRHTRAKHLNEKPFQCHMCDKAFPIRSQLTRHIKDHLSPPHYTCEHCGRSFSSRQGHHYHQLDHLGVKPHKCSVCGKAFRNKTDMINHERIHSGDRPFTCDICGKSFVEKGALRKHGVVHTREKNFVCSNCGKQFGYKCSLDGHLKKCQHDIHAANNLLPVVLPTLQQQQQHHQQHQQSQQLENVISLSGETPSSTHNNILTVATTSQDSPRDRNMMFPCSIQGFMPEQHGVPIKNRNSLSLNDEDILATAVLKTQEATRLIKKNTPYRQMSSLVHNASKQSLLDKHIQEAQMYPSYSMQIPHQRDTIDSDILATVLGRQKLPLQAQMEAIHYNDRMQRDEQHNARYHPLSQQDRDPTSMMDGSQATSTPGSTYNHHRHQQHQPESIADSLMFQHQVVRGHHYRP